MLKLVQFDGNMDLALSKVLRLCVITPQPTPYRDPFWNTVAEQPGVELDVFYCYAKRDDRPWDLDWPWKFHGEVLPGRSWLGQHNGYWNPSILKNLRAKRYDAIILGGYNHFTMLAAAWYARRSAIPYYLMSEVYLRQPRSWIAKLLKGPFLRRLLAYAAGGLPTGSLAKEYLTFYGLPEDKICFVPNSPDISGLKATAKNYWAISKPEIRRSLGLDPRPMVLFVGRLLALKNVDKLIIAFSEIARATSAQLVIIGTGPEEPNVRSLAKISQDAGHILFPGFVGPRDLLEWYCSFFLPTTRPGE